MDKAIKFYSSFEEENEAVYKTRAQRTGGENLALAVEIIKKVYHKELKNYKPDYKIYF